VSSLPADVSRLALLASTIADRPLRVVVAALGEPAYTDGSAIFVEAEATFREQRRQALVQAALLGAGGLAAEELRPLRGRGGRMAQRYLALEGRRALAVFGPSVPAVARLSAECGAPETTSPAESLALAQGRAGVAEAPAWFGQIRPALLRGTPGGGSSAPTDKDLKRALDRLPQADSDSDDADDDGDGEESKLLKLFSHPGAKPNKLLSSFFQSIFGMSRRRGEGSGADGSPAGVVRAGNKVGPHARPLPVPIRIAADDRPGAAGGMSGVLYPEWDEGRGRYRPDWCRVLELPLGPAPTPGEGTERDEVLRRRLARIGLGPMVQRGRPQGDDFDIDALIDATVDLRSGHSPTEHVYLERRFLRRDLGVLVLLDASGSATETDEDGRSVHEHQRKAAATLVATLEELGDRVALYAFRSEGRSSVSVLPLKRFSARFGNSGRGWLSHLEPSGYTRLGAAIRHAGEILKHEAGTPSRLLVVLSDGFPYDDGYEGTYAESDASRALAELREDGVACACLSIGTSTSIEALDRVFGAAAHAGAPRLSQLSGRMDTLFLSSLKELSRPRPRSEGRTARAGGATARRHRSPARSDV
jgi:nitric oxide reductase NorD protein